MTARVTIVRGDAPARECLLRAGRAYRIGRADDCDICIDDPELSRRHASISRIKGEWRIVDLDSKNGLVAAGRRVKQSALADGDYIGLGSVLLHFETLSQDELAKSQDRAQALRKLTRDGRQRLDAAESPQDVLRRLMFSVLAISSTERAFAMLTRPDGDLEVACSQGMEGGDPEGPSFAGCRGAVRSALATGAPVLACDVQAHPELARRQSVAVAGTRALVCLPLTVLDRIVGLIYADSQTPGKFFTDLDLTLLRELADHAALVVAAGQLEAELAAVDRRLRPGRATVADLRTVRDRIPDAHRPQRGDAALRLTGVRWSAIGDRA